MQLSEEVWIIMSKDRKIIAKGVPRNRCLCMVGEKNYKRILTYSSKGKAESGFMDNGFFYDDDVKKYAIEKGYVNDRGFVDCRDFNKSELEAVCCTLTIIETIT